jgi:hypothetical protein
VQGRRLVLARMVSAKVSGFRWSKYGPTDKTFRIAKPMRKVSWTKRFAAGGAEQWGTG